jgi:pimeloyl-ACP methyl ester carboxylesterase
MMPFSVLRVWGLGLLGWTLVGTGHYLSVLTYQQFQPPRPVREPDIVRTVGDEALAVPVRIAAPRDHWQRWALLAGATACLGTSFGGYWPVRLLLGNPETEPVPTILPSRTLSIDRPDGSNLHIEIYGDDSRPTLLFTHGWTLDSSAWDYVKPDLISHYRLVMWDLAGLGKSTRPKNLDHSIEKMAHDLAAVIAATATPSRTPYFLVGHSIGGMIQQTFCRLHPEHLQKTVKGMVLVHTTYTNPVRTNLARKLMTAIEKPVLVPLNYLTIVLAPLAWLSNWQSYLNGSLHMSSRFTSFSGKQTRRQLDHGARLLAMAWPATVGRGNFGMTAFDEERTLAKIDIPVLVLGGQFDRLTISAASDHIGELLPKPQNFRIGSGHFGHWELSHSVAKAIHDFVRLNSASPPNPAVRENDDRRPAPMF